MIGIEDREIADLFIPLRATSEQTSPTDGQLDERRMFAHSQPLSEPPHCFLPRPSLKQRIASIIHDNCEVGHDSSFWLREWVSQLMALATNHISHLTTSSYIDSNITQDDIIDALTSLGVQHILYRETGPVRIHQPDELSCLLWQT